MWGQEHPCDPTAAGRGGQGEGIVLPLDTAQQLLGKHPHPEEGGSYRQGACPCVCHPAVVFCAPDTNQVIGLCHKQLHLPAGLCKCTTPREHSNPRQQSQAQQNLVAVGTEELQHTLPEPHCSSRLLQKGFGLSLLLHTNVWCCNMGWRILSKGSSISLPLCTCTLHPLLGDK